MKSIKLFYVYVKLLIILCSNQSANVAFTVLFGSQKLFLWFPYIYIYIYISQNNILLINPLLERGPDAVVKAACLESPHSGTQVSEKQIHTQS